MKRSRDLSVVIGLLVVVAFSVVRLRNMGASWGDFAELAHVYIESGLFIFEYCVVLLGIVWTGSWWWNWYRRETTGVDHRGQHHWRRISGVAVLSVVAGLAAGTLSELRTPGWQIVIGRGLCASAHGVHPDLGLAIMLAVCVDSILCFAIFWGGYILWRRFHGQDVQKGSSRTTR